MLNASSVARFADKEKSLLNSSNSALPKPLTSLFHAISPSLFKALQFSVNVNSVGGHVNKLSELEFVVIVGINTYFIFLSFKKSLSVKDSIL